MGRASSARSRRTLPRGSDRFSRTHGGPRTVRKTVPGLRGADRADCLRGGQGQTPAPSFPSDNGPESPPGRNPRAAVRGCRLWGFNRAAARAGDAPAGVDGVGSTVAVMDWASRQPSRGRCYRDRGYKESPRRQWGDSGALPEAVFSGERFRGSTAGLYSPLPTLRSHPRGGLGTDRGRHGCRVEVPVTRHLPTDPTVQLSRSGLSSKVKRDRG